MMSFSQPPQQAQPQQLLQSGGNPNTSKVLMSNHQDYIHHIAFDVYGRRMATCSGDRFVRVWDLTDTGDWNLVGEWQAHRGNVSKICWAHPEFGSVLATCGTDSDAKIWEERTHAAVLSSSSGSNISPENAPMPPAGVGGNAATSALASRWTIKTQLTEARKAVACLEFAPRHWGLKLATGSADGCVRIYEAVDIMNLAQWPLAATLEAFGGGGETAQLGCLCLSWCTGRFEPPTLVVGGSHLSIFRYMEASRSWQPLLQLPSSGNQNLHILDVAWAPNVGRRFHYIASAEDQQLRVHKLSRTYTDNEDGNTNKGSRNKSGAGGNQSKTTAINNNKLEVEASQTLVANAWRCQWNVTGTVLASSGDAGAVDLWKSDNTGNFQCVAQVKGDLTQVAGSMSD